MNTQNENQETAQNSAYNPFPQPQTIPSGWDTSVFYTAAESDSTTEADDSAES